MTNNDITTWDDYYLIDFLNYASKTVATVCPLDEIFDNVAAMNPYFFSMLGTLRPSIMIIDHIDTSTYAFNSAYSNIFY